MPGPENDVCMVVFTRVVSRWLALIVCGLALVICVHAPRAEGSSPGRTLVVHNNTNATLTVKRAYGSGNIEIPPLSKRSLFNFLGKGRNLVAIQTKYYVGAAILTRAIWVSGKEKSVKSLEIFPGDFGKSAMFDPPRTGRGRRSSQRSVFASSVIAYTTGSAAPDREFANSNAAVGPPDWNGVDYGTGFVSLGCGGQLTLKTVGGGGMDVASVRVIEIGSAVEPTRVEIHTAGGWINLGDVQGSVSSLSVSSPQPVFAVRLTDLKRACGRRTPGADIDAIELIGQ